MLSSNYIFAIFLEFEFLASNNHIFPLNNVLYRGRMLYMVCLIHPLSYHENVTSTKDNCLIKPYVDDKTKFQL